MGIDYLFNNQNRMETGQEPEVWNSMRAGDKKALGYIYTRYFDKLYDYGIRLFKDDNLTSDCIQDLFIELWNKREGLSEVKSIKYYLYKCLRRRIIHHIEKQKRHPESLDLAAFEIQLSHKSHYLNQQINTDTRQRLMQVINTLTPKQREAIFLIYLDELSYEEAASIMDSEVKTVYNLVHLAIKQLKEKKNSLSPMSNQV